MTKTVKAPTKVTAESLRKRAKQCAVLIVAAGFERRAPRVLEMFDGELPARVVLVQYTPGVKENDDNYRRMHDMFTNTSRQTRFSSVLLNPIHPDEYLQDLKLTLLNWRPDAVGEVWIDVSALPMQAICATLAAVREVLTALAVRVLYTEAAEYYPTKKQVSSAEQQRPSALSQEMSGNLIPKHFAGSSSEVATCLMLFAGYEKHRSIGVVEELNPSKVVLLFGQPPREDLRWRLKWSRALHASIRENTPTSEETVSTLSPLESLVVLCRYYGFLFADHNVAISPVCSKMQCVAAYLMWERYRDVQLVFPLPVSYLPHQFSERYRDTYEFNLPSPSEVSAVVPSPL
jgi:hypothetical protein